MAHGKVIGGRYELGSRLGRGGMASVYAAMDRRLHREVALKLLESYGTSEDTQVYYFHREARAVAALRHTNIVQIYDYSGPNERPSFIVMELIDGDTVDHTFNHDVPEPVLLSVLHGVASALAHAHDHGVIHRDVKPSNVMLQQDGRIVLTDFGVAKAQDPKQLGDTLSGKQTGIVATPEFMAPEQVRDKGVSPATDVFSLGSLAYFLAVGRSPFANTEMVEVLRSVLDCDYVPLSEARPDLSESYADLIRSCLVAEPDDRPTSATFAKHCLALLSKHTTHTPAETLEEALSFASTNPEEVAPTLVAPPPTSRESGRMSRNDRPKASPPAPATDSPAQDITAPLSELAGDFVEPTVRHVLPAAPSTTDYNRAGAFLLGFLLFTFAGLAAFAWYWKGSTTPSTAGVPARIEEVPVPSPPANVPPAGSKAPQPEITVSAPTTTEAPSRPAESEGQEDVSARRAKQEARRPRAPKEKRRQRAKTAPAQATAEVATVRLVVKPWGTVFVDGKRRGNTPILRVLELTAGLHLFRVEHPQLGALKREVNLAPGETTLRFDFEQ